MKNIHLLPTDKRTRLYFSDYGKDLNLASHPATLYHTGQHLYITSDEEIKEGDCVIDNVGRIWIKMELCFVKAAKDNPYGKSYKIILTTDKDLIADGVQAIDDGFLEWFVKNPSCEEVDVESWKIDKEWDKEHTQFNPIYPHKTKYKIIIPRKAERKIDTCRHFNIEVGCDMEICYCEKEEETKGDSVFYQLEVGKEYEQEVFELGEEAKQDLEEEIFDLEQELDIPSHLRWHNSKSKQESLEEAADKFSKVRKKALKDKKEWIPECIYHESFNGFMVGAEYQAERMYSEKEVIAIVEKSRETGLTAEYLLLTQQFKKK